MFSCSSVYVGVVSSCRSMGVVSLFFSWFTACTARCRNCAVYMVIPLTETVVGMFLVVSMVFCSVSAVVMICCGVKVVGGVYSMGMLLEVNGFMVTATGRLPVLL